MDGKKMATECEGREAHEELVGLVKRAEAGDLSVLPQLRAALDANASVWKTYGDLAAQAEASLVRLAAGLNLLLGESLMRKLKAMKDELGGESPSPLERLLVERVSATWLQVAYYDGLVAQGAGPGEVRMKMLGQQQDAAHRRHLAAVKTLATVRKLLTPALSPVQIASRLAHSRPTLRLRETVSEGVAVEN